MLLSSLLLIHVDQQKKILCVGEGALGVGRNGQNLTPQGFKIMEECHYGMNGSNAVCS